MGGTSRQVTFLLTDIEGSTRLLARTGKRYPSLVAQHRRIITHATARAGGTAVPLEGDSCLAVFPGADAALTAALEAQRTMAAHAWPPDGHVRVRMGLHSGTAVIEDGEFFGLDLHRAARVAHAGHGGQILVSDTAREGVCRHLPPGVGLSELGLHHLRDLEAPICLYQVEADDLPTGFPPLRTLQGSAHNLPVQTSSLVGRDGEIAAVSHLLGRHRLVTVTGTGGIGKTRLALHVGARTIDAFPDGVWFVELARTRDPSAVPSLIAEDLGVIVSTGDPTAMITDRLRERVALLILDNVEHVIDAAPVISTILSACGGVRVLATSRERLLLTGEQTFALGPLGVGAADPDAAADGGATTSALAPTATAPRAADAADAVALFVARARSQRPSFAPTPADIADIGEICRLVDGLPLAIELAAAQARLLPVDAVRDRLRRGLDALSGGPRDRPLRHRALRTTIAWSYELLPDDEQRLFARLAVFQGGRSLQAVEAVCMDGLQLDVVDGMTALVDKSMVQRRIGPDGEVHFALLELLHEYAREALLASGEADAVHRRHAAWVAALVARADDELIGPDALAWENTLNQQLDNIRTALHWAFGGDDAALGVRITAALHMFWHWGGPHTDGHRWVPRALEEDVPLDAATRGRLHSAQGYFATESDPAAARRHFRAALDEFTAAADRPRVVHAQISLAATAMGDSDGFEEAEGLVDEGVRIAREFPDNPRLLADALLTKGELARAVFRDDLATACYEEALEHVRPGDDERYIAVVTANLAAVANHRGDTATAMTLSRAALTMLAKHNRPDLTAWLVGEVAAHAQAAGDCERAAVLIGASDAALTRLGVRRQVADRLEHERAVADLGRALRPDRVRELGARGAAMSLDEAVAFALTER